MTLIGMKKHLRVLEDSGLIATEEVGRRFDRLEQLLERTKGEA
jgi:hypothetical protein